MCLYMWTSMKTALNVAPQVQIIHLSSHQLITYSCQTNLQHRYFCERSEHWGKIDLNYSKDKWSSPAKPADNNLLMGVLCNCVSLKTMRGCYHEQDSGNMLFDHQRPQPISQTSIHNRICVHSHRFHKGVLILIIRVPLIQPVWSRTCGHLHRLRLSVPKGSFPHSPRPIDHWELCHL